MSDRDPHPDSLPEADNDRRSDIEQAIERGPGDVERTGDPNAETPLEPTGVFDGNSGTGGVVKNQDLTQQ